MDQITNKGDLISIMDEKEGKEFSIELNNTRTIVSYSKLDFAPNISDNDIIELMYKYIEDVDYIVNTLGISIGWQFNIVYNINKSVYLCKCFVDGDDNYNIKYFIDNIIKEDIDELQYYIKFKSIDLKHGIFVGISFN